MKKYLLIFLSFSFLLNLQAQNKEKLLIQINYGVIGNYSVRNYSENTQAPIKSFYKKNFIGAIGGIEARYNYGHKSSLGIEFSKSINKKTINYDNGRNVSFRDFTISHINYYNALDYEYRILNKKNKLALQAGIYYMRSKMQEIDVSPVGASIDERNFKNSKIEDGGILIGLNYFKKIDTNFDLGIKARITFSLAMGIIDAITLTPALKYNF